MTNSLWFVTAALVGVGFVVLGYLFAKLVEWRGKRFMPVAKSMVIRSASISQYLIPLINRLHKQANVPLEGSRLWIFGNDGCYMLKSNGKAWERGLIKWAKKGLSITCVLLDMDPQVKTRFEILMTTLNEQGCADKMEVFIARKDDNRPSDVVVSELENCHPTLLFDDRQKYAAWIEGEHRRDSEYAYDVHYFSPGDLAVDQEKQRIFDEYRDLVTYIKKHSVRFAAAST